MIPPHYTPRATSGNSNRTCGRPADFSPSHKTDRFFAVKHRIGVKHMKLKYSPGAKVAVFEQNCADYRPIDPIPVDSLLPILFSSGLHSFFAEIARYSSPESPE
jgi:hypothetical protein